VSNKMEEILGASIGFAKVMPGTITRVGQEIVYVSDDGRSDFSNLFSRLTKNIAPRHAKHGGKTSQGCRLWLPDGSLFHPVGYHGDIEGWRKDIELGAQQLGLLVARIKDENIFVSDGRSFPIAKCKVEFD
jgi:hypothetical protein